MAAEEIDADSAVSSASTTDASFVEVGRKSKKDRLFGNRMREACWAQADVVRAESFYSPFILFSIALLHFPFLLFLVFPLLFFFHQYGNS
jgi:hypothetical protein